MVWRPQRRAGEDAGAVVGSSAAYYLTAATETTLAVTSIDAQERQHEVDIGESMQERRYIPAKGAE